jgi:hypothetical protein
MSEDLAVNGAATFNLNSRHFRAEAPFQGDVADHWAYRRPFFSG